MKKSRICFQFMLVFMVMLTSVFVFTNKVYAKYSSDTSFKWDITGDGKLDTISFKVDDPSCDDHNTLYVYINDKKAATIESDWYFYSFDYQKLELKNGKKFLYISTGDEIDDGVRLIYQYKGGKLVKAANLMDVAGCRFVSNIYTKGNSIYSTMECTYAAGIGLSTFETVYNYDGGTLKLKSKVHEITGYGNSQSYANTEHETIVPIPIYSDKKCKKAIDEIPKGTKLKVTKLFATKDFISYYVTGDGYEGWYSFKELAPEGCMPIMIFDGVFCAG